MAGEVLIRAEGVGKKFCRDLGTSLRYGLMDITGEALGRPRSATLRPKEFWAVDDVSLEVRRGECLGLLGHNGAGKTTLLRLLNGLVKPDKGRIEIHGTVGALIALGAGFNPILTGRENIYVNASVLGVSRAQVDAKIDEVIAFSELGEFIDSPVRNYSSGMTVRLGFSVAAILLEPDILFLDEVLAVGDLAFTLKCLNLMRSIMERTACVFVSHSMPLVSSFCTSARMMHKGRMTGSPDDPMEETINRYIALAPTLKTSFGEGAHVRATVAGEAMPDRPGQRVAVEQAGRLVLEVELQVDEPIHCRFMFQTQGTVPLILYRLMEGDKEQVLPAGRRRMVLDFGVVDLNAGNYSLVVSLLRAQDLKLLRRDEGLLDIQVTADQVTWTHLVRTARIVVNDPVL